MECLFDRREDPRISRGTDAPMRRYIRKISDFADVCLFGVQEVNQSERYPMKKLSFFSKRYSSCI